MFDLLAARAVGTSTISGRKKIIILIKKNNNKKNNNNNDKINK